MLLRLLLGCIYFILFCVIIRKSNFIKKANIETKWLLFFFTIKVLAGFSYGYVHAAIKEGATSDTWKFYYQSLPETNLLFQNPIAFLKSIFGNGYKDESGFLVTTNSYWNDLKHNIMLFFMSICNIFSKNNYYVNTIFYNAVTFFGLIAFYRVVMHHNLIPKKLLLFVLFLLPSFVFWTSGFHKEGIIFSGFSFMLFSGLNLIKGRKVALHFTIFMICVMLLAFIRSYLLLFFIPFFLAFIINHTFSIKKQKWLYVISCVGFIVVFVCIGQISESLNMLNYVVKAHNDFVLLPANSKVSMVVLSTEISEVIGYVDTAFRVGFLEPITYFKSILIIPALFDNILILTLLVFAVVHFRQRKYANLAVLFLILTVFIFLFLGYTVPIVGAIIRYKSILLPFAICGIAGCINWDTLPKTNKFIKLLQ